MGIKKVLILVLSSQHSPYDKMWKTSQQTWDSVHIEGVETIFYFGNPLKENTHKEIYFPIDESYNNLGYKLILSFEWALSNKHFDYVARVNSSCYVDKKRLIEYVQTLPDSNVFAGGIVTASEDNPAWMWGGLQYVISKDVIEKIVDNKVYFDHTKMEDVAMSKLVTKIGVPYTSGKGCSIDKVDDGWQLTGYGTDSFQFNSFSQITNCGHHFYRVKQDYDRLMDKFVMEQLQKYLQ